MADIKPLGLGVTLIECRLYSLEFHDSIFEKDKDKGKGTCMDKVKRQG